MKVKKKSDMLGSKKLITPSQPFSFNKFLDTSVANASISAITEKIKKSSKNKLKKGSKKTLANKALKSSLKFEVSAHMKPDVPCQQAGSSSSNSTSIPSLKCEKKDLKEVTKKRVLQNAGGRSNRLYIKFKKRMENIFDTPEELQKIHPDIISVSLPRRGLKMRFFHAVFESEELAFSAMRELQKRGDCYVNVANSSKFFHVKVAKMFAKSVTGKQTKQSLRNIWQ